MPKTILVQGAKDFKIVVPDDSCLTYGPFSPPKGDSKYSDSAKLAGTLRVYKGQKAIANKILAVFTNVSSFRDVSLEYSEKVTIEEGATIWNSDQNGYEREEKIKRQHEWTDPLQLDAPAKGEG